MEQKRKESNMKIQSKSYHISKRRSQKNIGGLDFKIVNSNACIGVKLVVIPSKEH